MKVLKLLVTTIALGFLLMNVESFGAAASNPTQTVAGGGVTAKVTFLNPKDADDSRFHLVLDTHSVNLDTYDLKNIVVLRDDTGKSYVPTSAENKGSGHHREAIVSFPIVSPETKRLELIIKDVAGIKERTFVWNLN
jgi:hypothetical protein